MVKNKNRARVKAAKVSKVSKALGVKLPKPSKAPKAGIKAKLAKITKAKAPKAKIKLSKKAKLEARKLATQKAANARLKAAEEKQKLEEARQKEAARIRAAQEKLEIERLNALLSNTYARQFLVDLAGENTLAIMKSFSGRVSDEELSKNLKLKISDIRATLNKLHSDGLVSYVREKDNETGWFSYSWSLNREKIENWVTMRLRERIPAVFADNVENYFCPPCGVESLTPFQVAANSNFKCIKCERSLEFVESSKVLDEILGRRK